MDFNCLPILYLRVEQAAMNILTVTIDDYFLKDLSMILPEIVNAVTKEF
jgi:hypothetical protein